jgi:hypothetical protein
MTHDHLINCRTAVSTFYWKNNKPRQIPSCYQISPLFKQWRCSWPQWHELRTTMESKTILSTSWMSYSKYYTLFKGWLISKNFIPKNTCFRIQLYKLCGMSSYINGHLHGEAQAICDHRCDNTSHSKMIDRKGRWTQTSDIYGQLIFVTQFIQRYDKK